MSGKGLQWALLTELERNVVAHRPGLDLEALRVLTLVADLGSISAAARAEQISQPSASKRIQVLERQPVSSSLIGAPAAPD
jgi:molybdenum-dependent DNA-binding transcriptional regulator ModE